MPCLFHLVHINRRGLTLCELIENTERDVCCCQAKGGLDSTIWEGDLWAD